MAAASATATFPPFWHGRSFPRTGRSSIVQPPGIGGLHGSDESQAFAKLPPISRAAVDALCRLVLLEILPAVIEHDLQAFGAGLGELQERVGAAFAPAQGGIYATPSSRAHRERPASLGFCRHGPELMGPDDLRLQRDAPSGNRLPGRATSGASSASLVRRSSAPRRPIEGL